MSIDVETVPGQFYKVDLISPESGDAGSFSWWAGPEVEVGLDFSPLLSAGQQQVGQTEQNEQLDVVLHATAVARFAMLEQVLDDMEDVLDFGAFTDVSGILCAGAAV